ncbi:MAG: Coenzyme F420 hydrogenase/dehydrogenase, beta subunit C-terminal domain [Candidatus Shapirobacteria bacterium]
MVDKIVKNKLCANCGTCISACPISAISYKQEKNNFEIRVNKRKCSKCGLCLQVCPGLGVDFKNLNQENFSKKSQVKYDPNLGYFRNCYLGYSRNKKLRSQCASGGVATSILLYLLKNKIVDGALVTGIDSRKPLIPKPFIAYRQKEVIGARGSKYAPVVLNQYLKKIINSQKEKFAVVGLPCHIEGIRKLQKTNPILRKKIKFCLGLMCGQGLNFYATSFILKQLRLRSEEIREFQYRGEGWPGDITAIKKNGQVKKVSFFRVFKLFSIGFFNWERCFLCPDLTNELADISLGDAWIPRLMKSKKGINVIISRTQAGQDLVDRLKEDIFYKPVSPKAIVKSQKIKLFCKKDCHVLLAKVARILKLGVPVYNKRSESRIRPLSMIAVLSYLNSFFSNKFPKMFLGIPLFLWNLFATINKKMLNAYKKKF